MLITLRASRVKTFYIATEGRETANSPRGWRDCYARGVVLAFSATFNHVIKIAFNRF